MEVSDPQLLLRAAAVDKAAADLIIQAGQSPATLAAQDTPRACHRPASDTEARPAQSSSSRIQVVAYRTLTSDEASGRGSFTADFGQPVSAEAG